MYPLEECVPYEEKRETEERAMIVFRANDATEEDSDGQRIGADHGGDKDGDGGVHGMLNEWSVHCYKEGSCHPSCPQEPNISLDASLCTICASVTGR